MMNKTLLFLTCFVSFCVLPQVSQAEPIFGTPTLQPEVFSPNGDFVQDITSIEYDVVVDSAQVQISLTPVGGGSTIATLQALVTRGQGIHVFAFDGRVDDVVLDDGDYEIALFGIGTQGEGDELVTLPLTIDTEAPTFLAIDTIEPANAVVANGTAVVLDVCIEGTPSSVTADFSSLDSGFDNANVQVTPLDQTCFRIEYTISAANNRIDAAGLPVLLSAIDAGGNRAASETAYCLSNSPPEILSTSLLNEFSIFQNGDRIEVEVEFSSIALTVDVDADFSALDTQFNPAAVTEQSLSATRSRLTYVISEANTQIDGEYPIVVTVKDPGCGVAEDSSLSASLDNAGDFAAVIGDVFFALSEGGRSDTTQYSPKNLDGIKDDVTVAFSALEDTVLVTISAELKPPGFSVPQLVTILDQQEFLAGDYTFTWDGLSADGVIDARDLADQVIGIFVFGVSTDFDRRRNRRLELVLDNTPPQLESFIAPTTGIQNGGQVEFILSYDGSEYDIVPDFSNLDSNPGSLDIPPNEFQPGEYRILYTLGLGNTKTDADELLVPITATDLAGNVATTNAIRVCLSNGPPTIVKSELVAGDTLVSNGTTLVLELEVDGSLGPFDLTADFSSLDTGYDPGDETVSDIADGRDFRITYRISSSNDRLDGTEYPVVVTITDQGCGRTTAIPLRIDLDNEASERPVLDGVPGVVRTERITLSGDAPGASLVEVRFFGTAVDTFDVVGDRFSDLVTLNEGENRIQVVAIDAAGNRTTPSVPVEVFFVQSAFTDIPKRFGPGSEFFIGLLEPANRLLIHIFNLEGMLLQRIEGGAGDLVNIPWDGRDDRGQLLSSGPYIAVVEAFLNSGEVVRTRSAFVFSRTPVTAEDQ